MQHPENEPYLAGRHIERRFLSVKDAMQSEFAKRLVQCFGLNEVPRSKIIKSAVSRLEELKIFKDNTALHNPDTVAHFLHLIQAAGIVEEAGVVEIEWDQHIGFEPILRLSETGRKLYQSPLPIE